MDRRLWDSLSWQAKALIVWLGFSIVFFASVKLGIISLEPDGPARRPPFDRRECLQRKQQELYPGTSPGDLSDSAMADIAAACAHEEFD